MSSKTAFRKNIAHRISSITQEYRTWHSTRCMHHLSSSLIWKEAQYICAYIPFSKECNIMPLLHLALVAKKKVYIPLPDTSPQHLALVHARNAFTHLQYYIAQSGKTSRFLLIPIIDGIYPNNILLQAKSTLILVPGLGFSYDGSRLGRGGGFYDRLLQTLYIRSNIHVVGVCYERQLYDSIPTKAHDIPMEYILYEKELLACSKQ